MPMIDSDQIKPASDAVQAAFKDWQDAGQHAGWLKNKRPSDVVGIERAKDAVRPAWERYEKALKALAETTRLVIARAEAG